MKWPGSGKQDARRLWSAATWLRLGTWSFWSCVRRREQLRERTRENESSPVLRKPSIAPTRSSHRRRSTMRSAGRRDGHDRRALLFWIRAHLHARKCKPAIYFGLSSNPLLLAAIPHNQTNFLQSHSAWQRQRASLRPQALVVAHRALQFGSVSVCFRFGLSEKMLIVH